MKTIPWALSAVLASCPVWAAAQAVTVYGIADVFVEAARAGQGTVTRVESGGIAQSRLGFTGQEDLGGGLKAVFTLESGFAYDTGTTGSAFWSRQAFVGLSSPAWGSVTLGHQYTPLFLTTYAFDAFGLGNSGNYWNLSQYSTFWVSNAVVYETPVWSGWSARLLYAPPEQGSGIGRYTAGSLNYTRGALNIVASYDEQTIRRSGPAARHATLGGSYGFSAFKLFLGLESIQDADPVEASNHDASLVTVGAHVPVTTTGKFVGSVTHRDDGSAARQDATQWAVGYFESLSKRTTLYTTYGQIHNRNGAAFGIGYTPIDVLAGHTVKSLQVGVAHTF
ncbi:MAG: porin [Rubrivivax sp.]|nr:MAG: porin [Rubrivivax sp.]